MVRRLIAVSLVAAVRLVSAQEPTSAEPPQLAAAPEIHWFVGARLGLALPLGSVAEANSGTTASLSGEFSRAFPLQLEGGIRTRAVSIGIYYQYAFASIGDDAFLASSACAEPGASCESGRVKRFGVQAAFPLAASGTAHPWVGGGLGFERGSLSFSDPSGSADLTYKGFDLFAQGGFDWEVSPSFFLGPYALFTLGRYSDIEIESEGMSGTLEFANKRWHEWFQLGVRGRFDL